MVAYVDVQYTLLFIKEPLSIEQLVEVKASPLVKPKPPSATSIPAILKSLQV